MYGKFRIRRNSFKPGEVFEGDKWKRRNAANLIVIQIEFGHIEAFNEAVVMNPL